MVNFQASFVQNLATLAHSLYELLSSKVPFAWLKEAVASLYLKKAITEATLLIHYDSERPIVPAADASPYRLGTVIKHILPDGSQRLIAYPSRTLNVHDRKYAKPDREALAIIFAVNHFWLCLYGRHFTIQSDHRSLKYILGEPATVDRENDS